MMSTVSLAHPVLGCGWMVVAGAAQVCRPHHHSGSRSGHSTGKTLPYLPHSQNCVLNVSKELALLSCMLQSLL